MSKPKNCLENHKNCNSACCRYFAFNVELTDDLREYYAMHENTAVVGNQVIIMNKCKHLREDGKCKIYNKRPKICKEAYVEQKEDLSFPDKCIYKKD